MQELTSLLISGPRGRYAGVVRILAVAWLAASAGCRGGTAGSGGQPSPQPKVAESDQTALTGVVLRVVRNGAKVDTVKVERAQVETEPPSDQVFTDANGVFLINFGLAGRQYHVIARDNDVKGSSGTVSARVNDTVAGIVVLLGVENLEWPPPSAFEHLIPKSNTGPARVRIPIGSGRE